MAEKHNWLAYGAIAVVFILIGGAIGAIGFSSVETKEVSADYLTIDGIDYTPDSVKLLITDRDSAQDLNIVLFEDNLQLHLKYAELEREDTVLDIARTTIENEYRDKLDFDEEEYDDFYFKTMEASYDLDEEDGDYEVTIDFLIFQYDEDTDMLSDTYAAQATMEIEDDNDVDDLEIVVL